MADFGFVGPSYEAPSIYQDAQECINFFGEIDKQKPQGSRGYVALYPTPGLTKILQFEEAEVRGLRTLSGGELMVAVVGANVYAINLSYNYVKIGTLTTSTGYVSITDNITSSNGLTVYIVDGENRYAWIANTDFAITTTSTPIRLSGEYVYFYKNPTGFIYVGEQINTYGKIISYYSGLGGIGTYKLSNKRTAGTVTSINVSNYGSGYTAVPTVAIATPESYGITAIINCNSIGLVSATIVSGGNGAPYTTGDVLTVVGGTYTQQAELLVGAVTSVINGTTISTAGTGYTIGDTITVVGGTYTSAATFTVNEIDGAGGIVSATLVSGGTYSAFPSNPVSVTGGTGTLAELTLTFDSTFSATVKTKGVYTSAPTNPVTITGGTGTNATFNLSFGINNDFTIVNSGSFYTGNQTLVFSAINGTGAAATATVPDIIDSNLTTNNWLQMPKTDGPWTGATICDVVDNYIIYNEQNTQNWAATDIGYAISNNAYYGTKDGAPDPIVSIIVDHRQVFLIGQQTTEVWVDVGSTLQNVVSFPFQRVQGTMMQHGCAAPFSVARFSEQFMFVSKDNRGQAMIGGIQGYAFIRLSTHAVEQSLLNKDVSDAIAYTYQLEGHEFYVVTFPSIDLTWVYDLSTQVWHKWLSFDPNSGYHRHRSNCGAFFNNQYIVGDFENGKLYQVDNSNYTEDGSYIRRLRRAPHIVTDLQRQYFSEMQIQFQPGVGLQTGQGQDPQAMLRWSNDGGSTWSNEHWTSIGKVGRYKNRAIWRRLGWSRDRIYEVAINDPVKTVIVSANLKAEQGDN